MMQHHGQASGAQDGEMPDRKSEIIAATIRVITRDGWRRATIRAIAAEIGLTTGVLWHYFADKADILQAALRSAFEPWRQAVDTALQGDDPWQSLVTLFVPNADGLEAMLGQIWLNVVNEIRHEPELWVLYRREYGDLRDGVAQLVERCQRSGRIDAARDARIEADRLCGVFDGLMIAALGEPERFSPGYVRSVLLYHFEFLGRSL